MFKKGDNIDLSKASSVMNATYEEAKIQGNHPKDWYLRIDKD